MNTKERKNDWEGGGGSRKREGREGVRRKVKREGREEGSLVTVRWYIDLS